MRTLRVADVGNLGSGDIVDVADGSIAVVEADLLEGPVPVPRVPTCEPAVGLLEVGADVAKPDVVSLFEEPERHRSFLVEDKVDRVAKNAVLQKNRMAADAVLRGEQMMDPEHEAVLGLDVMLFALLRRSANGACKRPAVGRTS